MILKVISAKEPQLPGVSNRHRFAPITSIQVDETVIVNARYSFGCGTNRRDDRPLRNVKSLLDNREPTDGRQKLGVHITKARIRVGKLLPNESCLLFGRRRSRFCPFARPAITYFFGNSQCERTGEKHD